MANVFHLGQHCCVGHLHSFKRGVFPVSPFRNWFGYFHKFRGGVGGYMLHRPTPRGSGDYQFLVFPVTRMASCIKIIKIDPPLRERHCLGFFSGAAAVCGCAEGAGLSDDGVPGAAAAAGRDGGRRGRRCSLSTGTRGGWHAAAQSCWRLRACSGRGSQPRGAQSGNRWVCCWV